MNTRFQNELLYGDGLYDYMIHHFEEMMDEENKVIYNFNVWYTTIDMMYEHDQISKQYGVEIEQMLIPWLHEEYQSGRLFEQDHWKAFRDAYDFNEIYMGYRYLFLFHEYVFQLHLSPNVGECTECDNHSQHAYFQVGLYVRKQDRKDSYRLTDEEWDEINPVLL